MEVSSELIGFFGIAVLILLVLLRIPIVVALGVTGFLGYALVDGWWRAAIALSNLPFEMARNYSLSVLPLFILMGIVAARANMARELFEAANTLFSGVRGSLAMASVGACAGFGAISGSSVATAASIARIAVPEMQRHGYDIRLATGTVASAGTLGILIPPSIILVIYAVLAEESVPELFAAGILPGVIYALLHIALIALIGRLQPGSVPTERGATIGARFRALTGLWKLGLLFLLAVGGIYSGWFSPTEAAAVGALGAIVIAFTTRQMDFAAFFGAVRDAVRTTAELILVMLGGYMFSYFTVISRLPNALGDFLNSSSMTPLAIICFIVLIYLVLGLFLDSISMMLITVPVFLPILQQLGFDPLWFGIFIVIVAEVGLITPPVGMNIFVLKSQLPELSLRDLYGGILPFLGISLVMIVLLVTFPGLVLWVKS